MSSLGAALVSVAGLAVVACGSPPPVAPPVVAPIAAPPPQPPPAPAPAALEGVKLGPMVVTVSDARTAQIYDVVDRLARSFERKSRGAYGEWADKALPVDDAERTMLEYHVKLRKRRGAALDEAFYVTTAIDEAAKDAADKKWLTMAEADAERALLEHFGVRVTALLDAQAATIEAWKPALAETLKRAMPLSAQLGRFCETSETLTVPVFLVSALSPVDAGATWRGGRLVAQVRAEHDETPTFLHALFHVVFERRRGTFASAARKCDESIDGETMEEGVAYAFAPGLLHDDGHDVLADMVKEDAARPLKDRFVRYERLGLALRTALSASLEGGQDTLSSFLPSECEAWAKIVKP